TADPDLNPSLCFFIRHSLASQENKDYPHKRACILISPPTHGEVDTPRSAPVLGRSSVESAAAWSFPAGWNRSGLLRPGTAALQRGQNQDAPHKRRRTLTLLLPGKAGTSRCDVPARVPAGGTRC